MGNGILVTGAGGGIGLEVVRALLKEPEVTVWALARDGVRRLAAEREAHPGRVRVLDIDLAEPGAADAVSRAIGAQRLLAVVHNAAVLGKTPIGEYGQGALLGLFAVNVAAPLLLTQALAGNLGGDPPGHAVFIGSMGGFQDSAKFPGLAAYSASKAALNAFTESLALEAALFGIRAKLVLPGSAPTTGFGKNAVSRMGM
ncbi:MAG: SDR family NAD(P)-dependent oxidoreductase, partial [Flavobacteriales bacterium]